MEPRALDVIRRPPQASWWASDVEREGSWVHRGKVKRSRRAVGLADERGVALTEFVLVTPILVLVIAGMLSFGILFFYWLDANRLASETARWAVVDTNPFGVPLQQHIHDEVPAGMQDGLNVCIDFPVNQGTAPPGAGRIGDPVRVRIEKPYSFVPILGIGDMTIRASSTMRIERFADGTGPTSYKVGPPPGEDIGTCSP
jgi:hypothetical protein